jgi:FkbH-like protein
MEIWQPEQSHAYDLTFGLLEVAELDGRPAVEYRAPAPAVVTTSATASPKLKCVVWDLDNTLWSGVLVEDGLDGIRLDEEAARAVRALDAKGILQSIASKNNLEDALRVLKRFELDHFFIAPQISWGPKSEALRRLQQRLNIGLDTFALIDDQAFERAEVSMTLPEVAVFDPRQLRELLADARLDLPVTAESSGRRLLYKAEDDRVEAQTGFSGTYEQFLRSCSMSVRIATLAAEHIDRVYELAQRTNQLNISGYRYSREEISELVRGSGSRAAFVVSAQDRFGSYGLIGFVVFDRTARVIQDLMFSCRIQGKLVDDAFVAWLYETATAPEGGVIHARFKQTKKNTPARQLLERLGFDRTASDDAFEIFTKSSVGRGLADLAAIVSVDVSAA